THPVATSIENKQNEFFLSSRRRHTRFSRDWSSDVCSSDLSDAFEPWQIITHMFMHGGITHILFNMFALWMFGSPVEQVLGSKRRSEERRVGKECGYR